MKLAFQIGDAQFGSDLLQHLTRVSRLLLLTQQGVAGRCYRDNW
jgi:hypothetical protein